MKALVVLSGGQDSTTCLAWAIARYGRDNVHAVTFNYGQRHAAELGAARKVAYIAGIAEHENTFDGGILPLPVSGRHEIVDIPRVLVGTSPLVSAQSNVEEYKDAQSLPGGLEKTFVPMRNTLFLTLAANRAVVLGIAASDHVVLVTGVSQEDYGGYPDCRQKFISALQYAFATSLDDPQLPTLGISTPLMDLDKHATVNLAMELEKDGLPVSKMLSYSHTCYNGQVPPCGKCHACLLREKGFKLAGVEDPLLTRLRLEQQSGASA